MQSVQYQLMVVLRCVTTKSVVGEGKDSIMFLEAIECEGWSAKFSLQS